jgi:hypothetical protein
VAGSQPAWPGRITLVQQQDDRHLSHDQVGFAFAT